MKELIDKFGRKINHLRISVTDRCNLRCIYCMPLGFDISEEKFYSSEKIKEYISEKFNLYSAQIEGSGPARYYKVEEAKGSIGFISAISNNFCANCNRLRLTADGKIKPCLGNNIEVKIADRMSEGDRSYSLLANLVGLPRENSRRF